MLRIETWSTGRREVYDLHACMLDGVPAHTLAREELYRRLVKLKVGNIKVSDGGTDLLLAYARHLAATTADPLTGKIPQPEGDAAA
jgi:hypothetical protein